MTATTEFDTALVVGPNGGIFHVNAGQHTLAPGDSAEIFYAVVYGDTLPAMLAASDAAKAQYNAILSAVEEFPSGAPTTFVLQQNFPNPFNPSTSIRFELARRSNVRLTIYDVMGREVKTLVNGAMAPGAHAIAFNGSGLASGVYLFTLKTERFSATRKMLLLR
jgi:hypothetical protein